VVGAEFHRSHLSWADRFQVAAEVQAVAEQTRLDPLDVPTDGYALVNLRAGVEHPFLGRETRFDLGIHNLLDTEYRDFLSRYKAFALNPGRDVTIRLSMGL